MTPAVAPGPPDRRAIQARIEQALRELPLRSAQIARVAGKIAGWLPWREVSAAGRFSRAQQFSAFAKTLRVTPAMQAGVAAHVWSLEEWLPLPAVQH
jgi:hypothetical protein